MINIEKLCENQVILIDKDINNQTDKLSPIRNKYFSISNGEIEFNFQIIPYSIDGVYQIKCLSTHKYMILDDEQNLFFIEFYKLNKSNVKNTLFKGIYDKYAICFFPLNHLNLILTYRGKLILKNVETQFVNDEQTIYFYRTLLFNEPDLTIITKKTLENNIDIFNCKKITISNIVELFDHIRLLASTHEVLKDKKTSRCCLF